ncbi:MAG: T9SS type A sorting domain-containing protein, partial [Bacteroidota bacterium]
GNTQQVQSYQAYDEEPLLGRSFYRMKQTDLDGSFSLSNTVEVYFDGTSMTVFPNPVRVNETIYIDLFLDDTRHADLKLINQLGQTIRFEKYAFDQAENRLEVATADLSPGTYFIHIVADRKQFVKKILINPR